MGETVTSRHEQPPMARSALPAGLASESSAELSEGDPFTAYLLAAAGPSTSAASIWSRRR